MLWSDVDTSEGQGLITVFLEPGALSIMERLSLLGGQQRGSEFPRSWGKLKNVLSWEVPSPSYSRALRIQSAYAETPNPVCVQGGGGDNCLLNKELVEIWKGQTDRQRWMVRRTDKKVTPLQHPMGSLKEDGTPTYITRDCTQLGHHEDCP